MAEVSTRAAVIDRLKKSYTAYYNVNEIDDGTPIVARCEFFEHLERYFLVRKAELWNANCEEFLYILDIPHLTLAEYKKWRDYIRDDGMTRISVGPGHMYSYITPVFICDTCDKDALRALKRCHIYKSFRLSLHGWMDYHNAVVEVSTGRVGHNQSGHQTAKVLKEVLLL
ncbi:MAG: hypothetical protein LUC41_00040 [Clostridiales bacterium]|nr:hypothetical protein [Clostridiales bacterium]